MIGLSTETVGRVFMPRRDPEHGAMSTAANKMGLRKRPYMDVSLLAFSKCVSWLRAD
jgi:hypothetical protein